MMGDSHTEEDVTGPDKSQDWKHLVSRTTLGHLYLQPLLLLSYPC